MTQGWRLQSLSSGAVGASALLDILNVPGVRQAITAIPEPGTYAEAMAQNPLEALARTLASLAVATCTHRHTDSPIDDMMDDLMDMLDKSAKNVTMPTEMSVARTCSPRFNVPPRYLNGVLTYEPVGASFVIARETQENTRIGKILKQRDLLTRLLTDNPHAQFMALAFSLGTNFSQGQEFEYSTDRQDRFQALVRAGIALDDVRMSDAVGRSTPNWWIRERWPTSERTLLCHMVLFCFSRGGKKAARDLVDAGASLESGNGPERDMGVLTYVCTRTVYENTRGRPCAEIIDWLLDAGANLEARDGLGRTPLMYAAANNATVVAALLAAGADRHARDHQGMTALHHLCATSSSKNGKYFGDRTQAARWLLRGKDATREWIDARDTRRGETALMMAVGTPQTGVVRALLEAGADPNARGPSLRGGNGCEYSHPPVLWMAVMDQWGNLRPTSKHLDLLLEYGALMDARCCGRTILHHLVETSNRGGWPREARLLAARAFDAGILDSLMIACENSACSKSKGVCNGLYTSVLECCVRYNLRAVRGLVKAGANIDAAVRVFSGLRPSCAMYRSLHCGVEPESV